jgi:molybdenum cofactor cytidylyltransferase
METAAGFRVSAVVLAAGASTRLGEPKQLVSVRGESLLRRTAWLAAEAGCAPVFVVLGYEAERMGAELEGLNATAVTNEAWAEGMGSSLRRGMEAVVRMEPQPAGVLVLVCDQPRLTVEHLRKLLEEHRGTAVTASLYAGRAGVPAVFSQELYSELAGAKGDRGARDLIRSHASQVRGIPWPGGEVDVDRPEDLERLAVEE